MKQGKSAQIKKMRHQKSKQKFTSKSTLPAFNYNDFAGFLRARYYLMYHNKYAPETFEVASFFLDDVIATIVQQHFTQFTSNERATVNLNEVMQAALVNSDDKDWRYFVLLVPVLYDMQQFIVKESTVNKRFIANAPKFDINFWRMIVRTVIAINFFKWQGRDVAEMMKTSNAIDELQFKFLSENEDDDDFNLEVINETFRGLSPKMKSLKNTDNVHKLQPELTALDIQAELDFAKKSLKQFQDDSVKDVVSDNVTDLLYAFHEGMAQEFNATHDLWQPDMLNVFAEKYLIDYWTPRWLDLDGIGGEIKSYLTFLSKKKSLTGLGKLVAGTVDIDRYIDVVAINFLLSKLSIDTVEKLS
ncbi:metaphase chromosome protein 1 [Leuconostoc litchii]|uniref:Metaphase chromosome protein 1 n=1 Tax=Leuconostoc litchii TaxID=1981069 RepID=A0A652NDV8_9LACO|nr:metaphase chromosome protein 1 [Leuconostoc litchii]TYC46442.1 metaphase chromosome protein 1 [Leuconostoc litchii]